MNQSLPEFTQNEINQLFALAISIGYNGLSRNTKWKLDAIAQGSYVLKPETEE